MQETAFSWSHVEYPAAGAILAPGWQRIRGWAVPKAGSLIVDIRARSGGRVFPGIHGIPRSDLAAHFSTGESFALAEFTVDVEVNTGSTEIVLDGLLVSGEWHPLHAVSCAVGPGGSAGIEAAETTTLRWHEYGRAVEALIRSQREFPLRTLDELAKSLALELPLTHVARHAPQPFHGYLDEPAAVSRCVFGRLPVFGYLFHESLQIKRVLGTFDLQTWQTIEHRRPSPNAAAHYRDFKFAGEAGLHGFVDLPSQLPNPASLRIYAELEDGSLHLGPVLRTTRRTNTDEKQPYPAAAGLRFGAAHAALAEALGHAGITLAAGPEIDAERTRRESMIRRHAPPVARDRPFLRPAPIGMHAPPPRRILIATHSLHFEGAPLFLLDLARHYASLGSSLVVMSPHAGPLGDRLAALGATVRIVDVDPVFSAKSEAEGIAALAALHRSLALAEFDLVVANTFTTFWAVHLAHEARVRSLFYVHESTSPATFYFDRVSPAVVSLVESAFRLADAVSFTTAATANVHRDLIEPGHGWLAPGWIDVPRIDAWTQNTDAATARRLIGASDGKWLVTNIGTICDRKGQHIFARAVDLLHRKHPEIAARTEFVMLGGGQTYFDTLLADLTGHLNRPNLKVHGATPDYFPYYLAADLFVCSTYEESSPRVILEAMAFARPIIASGVDGIPEQVADGKEALLVPAGDSSALCEAMARALREPQLRTSLALSARTRVASQFDASLLLPRHAALAAYIASGLATS